MHPSSRNGVLSFPSARDFDHSVATPADIDASVELTILATPPSTVLGRMRLPCPRLGIYTEHVYR